MSSATTPVDKTSPPPSERLVSLTMQQGAETMIMQTAVGLLVGGLVGIVLARTGGYRKAITGLGAGIGLGSAWTRTSMQLEDLLQANLLPLPMTASSSSNKSLAERKPTEPIKP